MDLERRCQSIEIIVSDVDGVLTDGRVVFDNQGIETKRFHIRDGMGVRLWQKAGYKFGVVTQRSSQVVKLWAAELGVTIVRQGTNDKLATLEEILRETDLSWEQACYIGDDLPDLPVVRGWGWGGGGRRLRGAREAAAHVTQTPGGAGPCGS